MDQDVPSRCAESMAEVLGKVKNRHAQAPEFR
jgi:hypothetical protein